MGHGHHGGLERLDGTRRDAPRSTVPSSQLRKGDVVQVDAGQLVPGDGDVIDGVASVDESAITGESAPVHPRPRAP